MGGKAGHLQIQLNQKTMKYISNIVTMSCLLVAILVFGCEEYDEYKYDFQHTAVYFPQEGQEQTRSFIVNEDRTIQVGVELGGRRENTTRETVTYVLDSGMVDTAVGQVMLPSSYYEIANGGEFVIPAGSFQGLLEITIDTAFYHDTLALSGDYVLPFRLTETSADSILASRDSLVLHVTYEAEVFGHYYHNGVTYIDSGGSRIDTIAYHQEEPVDKAVNNWQLQTIGPYALQTNGIGYVLDEPMTIMVDRGHNVSVMTNAASGISITESGSCRYDATARKLYLEYEFENTDGHQCHALDTLIFRNRLLDGVNQWRNL